MQTALIIIHVIISIVLILVVLMQHGKQQGLSGAIAGGAETFFGKEKGKDWDKRFSKLTTIVSAVFVVAALVMFILAPDVSYKLDYSEDNWSISPYQSSVTTEYEAEKADK